MNADQIVKKLKEAADAYYNTGTPILTDDQYDALRDELEALDPSNPFLGVVGAAAKEGTVNLPVPMPSLNKIKPLTGAVAAFVAKTGSGTASSWVLSEKLDGISALWIPAERKLYLRGDGVTGQDVSHIVGLGVQGLAVKMERGFRVRGELVIHKEDVAANTIGRSWINGVLHRTEPDPADVAKIRFVAYEISSGKEVGTRQEQLATLAKLRYEVPWCNCVSVLDEASLAQTLKARRDISDYDIDGIVVGQNCVPEWHSWTASGGSLRNPKDQVAFKMVLSDQCAECTVVAVHWGLSYQGYYIPRLEIEPVRVGGAMITYVTGHNARNIVDKGIGKGARIRIRRSGDVIPTIDGVLVPVVASMPPEGTWKWVSASTAQGDPADAVHISTNEEKPSLELLESRLKHFAIVLEIDGLGPGLVKKLVAGGITTPRLLCAATATALSDLVGKKTGVSIADGLKKAMSVMTEKRLMIASGTLPRGVGETRLDTLFAVQPDPRCWGSRLGRIDGWSEEGLAAFLKVYPQYETWRAAEFPVPTYPILVPLVVARVVAFKGLICFTGFRDAALERRLVEAGYEVTDTVTKKTTVLVIPDAGSESSKVDKAQKAQIPIKKVSEFVREYNI
jgi:NAD-dependent DNA ligase